MNGYMMNASELDNGCELAATGAQEEVRLVHVHPLNCTIVVILSSDLV